MILRAMVLLTFLLNDGCLPLKRKYGQARWFKPVVLATREEETGKITVQALREKVSDQQRLGVVASTCLPSSAGSMHRRMAVQADPGLNTRPGVQNE
jgi:hypothetical protein